MLISPAFAQAAEAPGAFDAFGQFMPLILIFVVFYFLLFRPQQQKAKRHKLMVAALRRGDKILTQSGFIGTVAKVVNDSEMLVDLGENVRVRMLRMQVAEVLDSSSPVGRDETKKDGVDIKKDGDKKDGEAKPDEEPKKASMLGRLLGKK